VQVQLEVPVQVRATEFADNWAHVIVCPCMVRHETGNVTVSLPVVLNTYVRSAL
jgi:hypothetical protein